MHVAGIFYHFQLWRNLRQPVTQFAQGCFRVSQQELFVGGISPGPGNYPGAVGRRTGFYPVHHSLDFIRGTDTLVHQQSLHGSRPESVVPQFLVVGHTGVFFVVMVAVAVAT